MPGQISFLHAADLHLDSPFKGLARVPEAIFKEIQESTFIALNRLANTAIDKQVDFVLLVGDLFDNEKQSLKAQIRLRDVFKKLKHHHINVYLSYGNHDYRNGNKYPIEYPENVFIFPDETIRHFTYEKNGQKQAAIYGFSYENRAVHENKAKQFTINDDTVPFHIAMLHGSLRSNTEHDVYAPFHLTDLSSKGVDYWALGHIHKRAVLSEKPPIVYPGNIQGRNRKESGEKGCYHVVLSKSGAKLSFVPLHALRFNTITKDISQCKQPHELETVIRNTIIDRSIPEAQLITLYLTSTNPVHWQWETDGLIDDLTELINESLSQQTKWVYIYQCRLNSTRNGIDKSMEEQGQHFVGELMRHTANVSIQPFVKDLYQHREARKYLERMQDHEEESIKKEAQQYLIRELLHNGGESQ
ncbi:DNA repair exonuclease [Virgibacillus dakarensis]|uniref:DNA repair exonuclease n=1 Tax=Lentibacillus populi TaxID=1827502 RepID=A0A9W5X6F3_9BACI|nr:MULTISPECIES: DNA repair exonuclease [Bacillaceae]MBT2218223.1 DNA repair exonuclease [Virgibacillus dakarensis]MTW85516.1 DNA repair exonuclease [Virgibacillus dakarensis]GGB51510.1 DNA repair exonuclease [Lentibacillus populi]